MANYIAEVHWNRGDQNFLDNQYSRQHLLRFDGGIEVPGSSSPQIVPVPMSVQAAVDPEEAFVASLASCHMLWFLSIAANYGFCVDRYTDIASGRLEKNAEGKLAMTVVTLKRLVQFSGNKMPTPEQVMEMHHQSHESCFIANSVKTQVLCEPIDGESISS